MSKAGRIDRPLGLILVVLVIGGAMVFASAAFGLLARGATNITSVVFNHLALGIGAGLVALIFTSYVHYREWRRFAPYLYAIALVATALVFVPHVGLSLGGGRRWIDIAGVSLQPSESLKIASIMMAAAYFTTMRARVETLWYGLGGYFAILIAPIVLLVLQPDLGTLGVVIISVTAVFLAAGARIRDLLIVAVVGILALALLTIVKPYVKDRVMVFFDPSLAPQAEGYQIKQSLIAIGSGGITGRGFGQGVQKFTYLPEPMGDSIFAVIGEEFGFVGSLALIGLFLSFALRGYTVSVRSPDPFGALLGIGIATYLASEAFINIAAMLGVAPLTGIPLTFVSQGGTAMLASLGSVGILLNISRKRAGSS